MERKTSVRIAGILKPATEITDFEIEKEPWAAYRLPDGTQVRAKVVITNILRLDDEVDDNGDPNYYVRHTIAVTSTPGPSYGDGQPPTLQ